MSNTTRYPQCHMRTALGNCDPIGGFCTSVNESVCEALHKVSRPQGDSVSRRYLLAEIDDLADEFSEVDENGLHSERWCGISDSKCVIMNAPFEADRLQEWIPCSERLPKEDGFYLVTITDGEQIAVCKMPFVESEWKGNWFDDEVIAWMPLPEPWKGVDDE